MVNLCFLIMPCLNEEKTLRETCESLGFGSSYRNQRKNHHLVVVDNGSNDRTVEVAEKIRDLSIAGTVHIVSENILGFVPARSAGVKYVQKYSMELRCPQSECLILQVDADAEYSRDYPSCFEETASIYGLGNLFEAESIIPTKARDAEITLLHNLGNFDERFFERIYTKEDFVVDDKIVGYFLQDWNSTGGLKREYLDDREYIFCGTSRMWIRMRSQGFRRQMVAGATCAHSLRKLKEGAAIYSASAGWPRGSIWKERWRALVGQIITVEELIAPNVHSLWNRVLTERERHLQAMFFHLPMVYEESQKKTGITPLDGLIAAFARSGIDLREDLYHSHS